MLYFDLVVDVLVVLVVVGLCGAFRGAPVPQITGNSSFSATWSRSWCASATDLGEKLTSGALDLTESYMMLPGASVCGLVFSHPEAQ